MSDFRLNCERLLAVTREHFFAGDDEPEREDELGDGEPKRHPGDGGHRVHGCA